jgi:hypothetical protein
MRVCSVCLGRRRLTYTVDRAWLYLLRACGKCSIRDNAQGIESILVANKCLYRTIILGGASRFGMRATAQKRATWH